MAKFTFKTENPTGRYKAFNNSSHIIKLNNKEVGSIVDKTWEVRLMVYKDAPDSNPNCNWKWITLVKKLGSLEETKTWLNTVADQLISRYKLRTDEEESKY